MQSKQVDPVIDGSMGLKGRDMRVGLLEDDVAIQEMLFLVLQDEGYSVVNFSDAEACLATFKQQSSDMEGMPEPVDLIIVDWRLNGPMSGIEVIRQIRELDEFATLPVILTTAATFSDTEELQQMHVALLEKPFSVDDMATLVKELITAASRDQAS